MAGHFKAGTFCAAVMFLCVQLSSLSFAGGKQVVAALIPTQITTAKKVFIANAGQNQPFSDEPIFSGSPQRAYDEFYAGVKAAGRYELVSAPADADVSFEIELAANRTGACTHEASLFSDTPYDPYFRVVIRDSKTNAILWVTVEHVQWAILQGNRDKNFDQAIDRTISDIQFGARSTDANGAKP